MVLIVLFAVSFISAICQPEEMFEESSIFRKKEIKPVNLGAVKVQSSLKPGSEDTRIDQIR